MTDEEARQALDELIRGRGEDYAGLSRLLGRNPAYIQQHVKRGSPRRLAEADRWTLARYFGVAEAALGGPDAAKAASDTLSDAWVRVPRLSVDASAGPGRLAEDEHVAGELRFPAAMLRRLGAGRLAALSLLRVAGDSMAPTLADGHDILVDTDDAVERLREGIYVIRLGDGLMVKRLAVGPAGEIGVSSDNPAGPQWQDVDRAELRVIGRVLWVGGRVR